MTQIDAILDAILIANRQQPFDFCNPLSLSLSLTEAKGTVFTNEAILEQHKLW
jgi:hypothetical protein